MRERRVFSGFEILRRLLDLDLKSKNQEESGHVSVYLLSQNLGGRDRPMS